MKKLIPLMLSLVAVFNVSVGQPVVFDWTISCGGKGNYDGPISTARDAAGDLYITGEFSGTKTFGSYSLTSLGFADVFVAKYSSTGTCLWATSAGANFSSAYSGEIAVVNNSVFFTGYFSNILTIGTGSCGLFSTGFKDIFLASLDATSGNCNWLEKAGGTYDDYGISMSADAGGGVILAGTFADTATFGSFTLTSSSIIDNDIFVAKYSPAGTCLWAKKYGNSSQDILNCVRELPSGKIMITGAYENTIQFSPAFILTSVGFADIYLAELDGNGALNWAVSAGSGNTDVGYGLGTDNYGNIYMTGYISDTATFGPINVPNNGNVQFFIAKFSQWGVASWVKTGGNVSDDIGYDIVTDTSGSSFVTGYINGNCTFAGTPIFGVQAIDAFVAKFNAVGDMRWFAKIGGPNLDKGKSLILDTDGYCFAAGDFADYCLFGSTPLTTDPNTWNAYLTRIGGGTVSLDESDPVQFQVYPNPASEAVYLDLSAIQDLAFTVELFSTDGKRVLVRTLNQKDVSNRYKLSLDHVPAGMYLLNISTSKGEFSRNLSIK